MIRTRTDNLDNLPRNFANSVEVCMYKYTTIAGRAPRAEYWYFYLFNVLAQIFATLLDSILHDQHPITLHGINLGEIGTMGILFYLALLVPNITVQVRRLHDRNWSGWYAILLAIPFGVLVLIVLNCLPGTPGPNRFGTPVGMGTRVNGV